MASACRASSWFLKGSPRSDTNIAEDTLRARWSRVSTRRLPARCSSTPAHTPPAVPPPPRAVAPPVPRRSRRAARQAAVTPRRRSEQSRVGGRGASSQPAERTRAVPMTVLHRRHAAPPPALRRLECPAPAPNIPAAAAGSPAIWFVLDAS